MQCRVWTRPKSYKISLKLGRVLWNRRQVHNCFEVERLQKSRPDTSLSRRQRRRLPLCPLVIALVPLKCYSRKLIYNFFIGCPSPRRKCRGALAHSKTNHTGLKVINRLRKFAVTPCRQISFEWWWFLEEPDGSMYQTPSAVSSL